MADLDFIDISTEQFRVYTFPGGDTVCIDNPKKIAISDNGHRVDDSGGRGHYVPAGWIHLMWAVKGDAPVFTF